ncbi:phosphatidylinositol glycan anchor biosynthesis class U-like protein isoform X2 [Cinnamomum micranthum f. kanehirae]|uniref:Phosphatidylinositol glycan anchor biosynthesis class U-like protein isoform X2 n=1 Tax=Cinnamomum micranthum f. kanehirae TaxID=337451 RepID=A0A3S4PEG7_9MAGN|nr:phosphatidylinositol glycan anchor biosynthesis class U-like protein isoform X2 [Cinnamomum micranthum f. kanehirae]
MANNRGFWASVFLALLLRLVLIFFSKKLNLGSRPEIATPLTSLRRLAEGYWLKQSSMSPYAGSMYHGSPLLLSILGPLTVQSVEVQTNHIKCSLMFVIADFITAMLIRATGQKLQLAYSQSLRSLDLLKLLETSKIVTAGDVAALVYLWNPLTIVTCVGSATSPIENLMVVLSLYGACSRIAPLAAFGWVVATHLSLYPAILIVPVILLLGYGSDSPPKKLFCLRNSSTSGSDPSNYSHDQSSGVTSQPGLPIHSFTWKPVVHFILWASIWSFYVLILCSISLNQYGGLYEMFQKTHGFILTVEDLSPNIGVLWYFFAEVFDFFRIFFLIVFHVNILFMLLPLAIRLNHRPFFLAFVYVAISSMLKSYPSVGDTALYLGLLGLFVNELADMHFSFFLFCGYVGVGLLSPVMHNLWIWRGTGNANFYFATAIAYALLQIILVVESVGAMLNHDRMLRKHLST